MGVNAQQDGRAWPLARGVCGIGVVVQGGRRGLLGQSAKDQQVVMRGEVVARGQLPVEQVRDVQVDQALPSQLVQAGLDGGQVAFKIRA